MTPSIEASTERRWTVLAVLCLSILLVVAANMSLNVALPTLGRHLHAGVTSLQWVVDIYVLCFAGLLLPGGAIGDRFGRKGTLQVGLVLFAVASGLGAVSTTTGQLLVVRAAMGVAAALVMPGTLSILTTVFPPEERPVAIAIWASVAGASVALSITWSGFMLEHFWWGSIFLGMTVVAVVALVVGWPLLPTSRHPEDARIEPVGALLSIVGVSGLLFGFIEAPDDGWLSTPVVVALVVGVAGLVAFVVWEHRVARPMLDVRFFAAPRFAFGSLAIAAAYFALFGMYFVFTQYFQLVRGYSPLQAGVAALPAGLAQLAVANLAKPLVARHGFRTVLVAGLVASAGGLGVLATSGASSPLAVVEVGLGLLGVGIGLTMPPASGAIMSSLPPAKAGVGSAVNDLARELGGAFGIGLLGSVTLLQYRHRLDGAGQPAGWTATARQGLAQAVGTHPGGGTNGSSAAAAAVARHAFTSGLAWAMALGAVLVLAVAAVIAVGLRPGARPAPSAPASSGGTAPAASAVGGELTSA